MGHRLTAFGNVSQSGSLLLRRTPHCPTRKNSVVNNQKFKNSTKKEWILWTLASLENPAYIPVVVNFTIFFFNDMYGFISWRRREILMDL